MIKPKTNIPTYSEHDDSFFPTVLKEEIEICTKCPLPRSACNETKCERYTKLMAELKAKKKILKKQHKLPKKKNYILAD